MVTSYGKNIKELKWIVNENINDDTQDYLMFMLHSSELMPGGSPTFQSDLQIDKLYKNLNELFEYVQMHYEGITLKEYANRL